VLRALDKGGDDVNCRDALGRTPLHYAAARGRREVVCLLLQRKADPNAIDEARATALHRAAARGHEVIVSLLVRGSAAVDAQCLLQMTALHYAAKGNHEGTVKALLRSGADVKLIDNRGRRAGEVTTNESVAQVISSWAEVIAYSSALGSSMEQRGELAPWEQPGEQRRQGETNRERAELAAALIERAGESVAALVSGSDEALGGVADAAVDNLVTAAQRLAAAADILRKQTTSN